jgi:HlyD family secretion protein
VVLLEAALLEAEANLARQKDIVKKLQTNIANTMIYAPADGMVVYATSQDHHRGSREPLDVGQQVRERRELIHLPTSDKVKAEIKVHESSMCKVKVGLPVVVTVVALSERAFTGRVVKIAMLPDAQMVWLNPDLKIYTTEVHIDGDNSDLRTGMSCRASIVVDQYEDVVYVPVQAVVRIGEQPTVYVVKDGKDEIRNVEIGLDNNRMVHVISGLEPGERVKLAPPLAPAEAEDEKARNALEQTNGAGPADGGSGANDDGNKQTEDKPEPPGPRKPVDPRDT